MCSFHFVFQSTETAVPPGFSWHLPIPLLKSAPPFFAPFLCLQRFSSSLFQLIRRFSCHLPFTLLQFERQVRVSLFLIFLIFSTFTFSLPTSTISLAVSPPRLPLTQAFLLFLLLAFSLLTEPAQNWSAPHPLLVSPHFFPCSAHYFLQE